MEIKEAIKSLKNNKAAGPDNIPAEVTKADIDTSAKAFLPFIIKVWNDERFSEKKSFKFQQQKILKN